MSSTFDTREYLAALGPPEFIALDGHKYVGRVLSADEWAPLELTIRRIHKNKGWNPVAFQAVLRRVVNAFFPPPLLPWRRSAWRDFRKLPPTGQLAAFWTFMRSQERALGWTLPTLTPGMLRSPDARSRLEAEPQMATS